MLVPAVQLYSVRAEMTVRPTTTLTSLAAMGYRAVEPTFGLLGDDPRAFRELLEANGLTACSLHGPLLDEHAPAVLEAAAAIGTDTVIIPAIPPDGFSDRAAVEESARLINAAAARAAGAGLRLGYHNHHWELAARIGDRHALEVLAELLDPDVLLEVDLYWAVVGGADVPGLLSRLGDRVTHLHVKDGPGTVDDAMTAVGSGTLPIPDILAAAPADAWRIVELDRCDGDMLEALAASRAYLDGLGG
ncbi:sugar phosphate isomerase/epimerase family protein [Nonomuraea ferruginea]|uniref:Sugar phosphate isomerase/epimerase n=1 Tax=Nonomuraea ferruginea TaxID=46174 RepID=A0ABT4SUF7_9ACTN|nr:sugar phosphate isomerase/epimerase [Nonomuraea ferruginea]MDA0640675.1 sugar phosphate isomerase/epimerase [Nonomuraea ferruginea]